MASVSSALKETEQGFIPARGGGSCRVVHVARGRGGQTTECHHAHLTDRAESLVKEPQVLGKRRKTHLEELVSMNRRSGSS